jgi:hypothetical protein
MVFDLGCICPFALILMDITVAKKNSTYISEMNVPRNCKESEECLQIFNTVGALTMPTVL